MKCATELIQKREYEEEKKRVLRGKEIGRYHPGVPGSNLTQASLKGEMRPKHFRYIDIYLSSTRMVRMSGKRNVFTSFLKGNITIRAQ